MDEKIDAAMREFVVMVKKYMDPFDPGDIAVLRKTGVLGEHLTFYFKHLPTLEVRFVVDTEIMMEMYRPEDLAQFCAYKVCKEFKRFYTLPEPNAVVGEN